ncbi:AAA family ATPase [Candidatus Nomurabacteria bacterium]|nr:AAA family ATPase [Candidatus Kaiserbacteria bacterium]MCB9815660.1 AAA family ATPase [Candidatus Nomurabacteria bacterium]
MTQERALDILKTGANVFLTGEPGAGKTYVINKYVAWLEAAGLNVAVTASTGIAATHIGGMTIHSWSGFGIKGELTPYDLEQIAGRERLVKRMKKAHVLVIDEISMLDGRGLDMVDQILRTVLQKPEPFGGLQVVCIGDFFQLPPVTRQGDMMRYAFESNAWLNMKPLVCYITEQYRQEDEMLLGLLGSIRRNEIEEEHYTLLNEQKEIAYEQIEPTRLYTHNADVDAVNTQKLAQLPGAVRKFKMEGRGRKPLIEGLAKNCLSPELLELKEDAMVMCTKNNFEQGYVNGTLGRVVRFDEGYPVIETTEGKEILMKTTTWEMAEDGKILAQIEQLPLRLAWAITVHKSQGMSLDAAEIDLSKAFVYGQGYVALSRVRSLDGLKVLGMHPNALQVDPKVIMQDAKFHKEAEMAEDAFIAMEDKEVLEMHERFVVAHGGKVPSDDEVGVVKVGSQRVQAESTYAVTKTLILEGRGIKDISDVRGLTETTVWTHIERLVEDKELTAEQIKHLEPTDIDWNLARQTLNSAMDKHGTEKLKPIYEAAKEEYDYTLVRLARMQYWLEEGEVVF